MTLAVVRCTVRVMEAAPANGLCAPVGVTGVPYAVWDNREPGEMRVWFRSQ